MQRERGDSAEYARLRRAISDAQKQGTRTKSRNRQRDIVESLSALKTGDVVTMPAKRVGGRAVIIAPMSNRDGTSRLPTVLTEQGKVWHLRPHEVTEPVADRKSTRLNSSHVSISYAVFCLKKKKKERAPSIAHHES